MRVSLREGLVRAGLVVASLGVTFLAIEIVLRATGYLPEGFQPPRRLINSGRHLLLDCYPTDPRHYFDVDLRVTDVYERYRQLGMRRLDRAAGRAPHCVEVRYNSERYRGDELPDRRPGVRRVAVLGDSFTEGQGVRQADTYPRLLERRLNRQQPDRWEVLCCARRALDFPALHEEFYRVLRHEPDVIIYAMVLNDVEQSSAFRECQQNVHDWITVRSRRVRRRYRQLGLLDSRLVFLVQDRIDAYCVDRASTRWYRELYGDANHEGWAATQERIRDMHRRTRERDGQLLIVTWPLLVGFPDAYPFEEIHAVVKAFCRDEGIPQLDLLAVLREQPVESLIVHCSDHHPNERAHALAARGLEPLVRRLAGTGSATTVADSSSANP
jgi:hypothetical protein